MIKVTVIWLQLLVSIKIPIQKEHIKPLPNLSAVPLMVHRLEAIKDFYKSRSKVKVKVTRSNILVWLERSQHKIGTCEV